MALTTTRLRELWGPQCTGPWARVQLFGEGAVTVRASIVDAVRALNACLAAHNYWTRSHDTGAYNCRRITGGTGWSLHAYGIAIDINWQSNPYGPRLVTDMPRPMVDDITRIRTNSGAQVWRWGGTYSGNKDAMHYEIVCSPADIASGINYGGSMSADLEKFFFGGLTPHEKASFNRGAYAVLNTQHFVLQIDQKMEWIKHAEERISQRILDSEVRQNAALLAGIAGKLESLDRTEVEVAITSLPDHWLKAIADAVNNEAARRLGLVVNN